MPVPIVYAGLSIGLFFLGGYVWNHENKKKKLR
jgi:hypothetical protein